MLIVLIFALLIAASFKAAIESLARVLQLGTVISTKSAGAFAFCAVLIFFFHRYLLVLPAMAKYCTSNTQSTASVGDTLPTDTFIVPLPSRCGSDCLTLLNSPHVRAIELLNRTNEQEMYGLSVGPGWGHFEKVSGGGAQCAPWNQFLAKNSNRESDYSRFKAAFAGMCIVARKIDAPTTNFAIEKDDQEETYFGLVVNKFGYAWVDQTTGAKGVLSRLASFVVEAPIFEDRRHTLGVRLWCDGRQNAWIAAERALGVDGALLQQYAE